MNKITVLRKYAIIISTLLLCGLLFLFLSNLHTYFKEVEDNYKEHRAVNLSKRLSKEELSAVLLNNGYIANKKEADFIADTLTSRLHRNLKYSNLYHLQKRAYGQVPALVADSVGVFPEKLRISCEKLGQKLVHPPLDSITNTYIGGDNTHGGSITVHLYSDNEKDLANAIVLCQEYCIDSINRVMTDTIFAKTNSNGVAVFRCLDKAHAYSVLPIKKGYEYGPSKGVKMGKFDKDLNFHFEEIEHRIQMIDNTTLKQIKNDGTITVRTPQEYKEDVIKWFVLVLLAWWVLVLIMVQRKRHFDPLIVASAMFLTGLCVIVMFAIQNPLTEELRGAEMASGVLIGIVTIIVLQFVDFIRVYQDNSKIPFDPVIAVIRWLFLPFKQKVSYIATCLSGDAKLRKKIEAFILLLCCVPFALFNIPVPIVSKINKAIVRMIDKLPKGLGWLILAILVTLLLFTPLGKSIGGMKVNLSIFGLTFQPSEIAKYLILFFMAAYFTNSADSIIAYSYPNHTNILKKIKSVSWLLAGLIILIVIYGGLGDMGPGLVITITFILLYSLVKSKVNLDNLSEKDRWTRILTCDFAMLIYGILSFALLTYIGYQLGNSLIFAMLWFLVWIGFGLARNKQFYETAFFFNLIVFLFIFGGKILASIPALQDNDTTLRFEQRTRMCMNTWGYLDILYHGNNAEPVSNTQVANGLWAIATGGVSGQGLGEGNPNLIPAFHTDMILSSIAEEIGWVGLLLVVFTMAILLRRIIVVGYRVGHPFAFYFCMGVAIVTAVQFFIIALGSSGMIPLTGVTVPYISYGRVSMILNLVALGVVLSLSKNMRHEGLTDVQKKVRTHSVGKYNYPVSIVTWTYIILALFTLGVWQYYSIWARSKTLIHPAYVLNNQGLPLIEYNPRIALLTREMFAGNIYDRKGVLLATSNRDKLSDKKIRKELLEAGIAKERLDSIAITHTKRYYPFGEHLFFMLGDQNSGLYFNYDEDNPIGYIAEAQHLSYLRNYDNTYYDKQHHPVKLNLKGQVKANSRFLPSVTQDTTVTPFLRDNKALIKFLKTGIHGRPLKKHNKKVLEGNYDLHLTLDATLQKDMQDRIKAYVEQTPALKNNNLLRISAVILDAENGDLLTSANYPLPIYQRLREEDSKGHTSYSDNRTDREWHAYTERDLGLTYQTMPGSTAKIMSAIAGIQKMGISASDKKYLITEEDIIEKGKFPEPHGYKVTMKDAIVYSSNCYFINLVNDNDLYMSLDSVYESAGVSIGNIIPYNFNYNIDVDRQNKFREKIRLNQGKALIKYSKRIEEKSHKKMNEGEWRWAWGQGYEKYELQASPLNMARIASSIVNKGKIPYTKFILPKNKYSESHIANGHIQLMPPSSASILKSYMLAESANQKTRNKVVLPNYIGGKTGTPERDRIDRDVLYYNRRTNQYKLHPHYVKHNDGWYMFFVEGTGGKHSLAVCVRMERSSGSGAAVRLTQSVILESLYKNGYISSSIN